MRDELDRDTNEALLSSCDQMSQAPRPPISEERVAIIQREAEIYLWNHSLDFFVRGTSREASTKKGFGKRLELFAAGYWALVNEATGHLVFILAQAIAFQKGLEDQDSAWIKSQAEDFVRGSLSPDAIRDWLAIELSVPMNRRKTRGFDAKINKALSAISRLQSPMDMMEYRLGLAIAVMGKSEPVGYARHLPPHPQRLMKKQSLTQKEAAALFGVTDRTIFDWLQKGRLTRRGRRVAHDEKLDELYRDYGSFPSS